MLEPTTGPQQLADQQIIIPPVYEVYMGEVYRGYIVFAFSVRMFVCVSVNFFFRQRFLRNYLTFDLEILYKHQV